jgi:hypothetical protein
MRVTVDDGPPLEISKASVRWANQYEFGLKIDHVTSEVANRLAGLIHHSIGGCTSTPRENA